LWSGTPSTFAAILSQQRNKERDRTVAATGLVRIAFSIFVFHS
jgi:hypothetical protein